MEHTLEFFVLALQWSPEKVGNPHLSYALELYTDLDGLGRNLP
jgi:hypothetical protein